MMIPSTYILMLRPASRGDTSGKERDVETGLDYFGARYFSGAMGRFTSPDAPFADQRQVVPQSWNLYAYARNNPVIYIDSDGRKVKLNWHKVAFGNYHTLITIIPENQMKYKDISYMKDNIHNGKHYMTLGAGPEGGLLGIGETLVSNPNREKDAEYHEGGITIEIPKGYADEDSFIDALIGADANYGDNLDYELLPEDDDKSYNSNSYTSGLLNAVGAVAPTITVNAPGYDKPVPKDEFENNENKPVKEELIQDQKN